MITKWKLRGFKSVQKETELDFGPITIFAGANSSGKSSWIQSILMISQTLAHRISSRSVVLNGTLARLGQFNDLHSFSDEANEIVIGWECRPRVEEILRTRLQRTLLPALNPARYGGGSYGPYVSGIEAVSCEIAFDSEGGRIPTELRQLQPSLVSCRLRCHGQTEDSANFDSALELNRALDPSAKESDLRFSEDSANPEREILRRSLEYDAVIDPKSLEEVRETLVTAGLVGCELHHFLPRRLCVRVATVEELGNILASIITRGVSRALRGRYFSESDVVIPLSVLRMLRISLEKQFEPFKDLEDRAIQGAAAEAGPVTLRDWVARLRELPPVNRWNIERQLQLAPDLSKKISVEFAAGRQKRPSFRHIPAPVGIDRAVAYLSYFFANGISYLGPLRDEPKALYPLPPSPDLSDVGLRGEFTAAVLDLHKNQYIDYVRPEQVSSHPLKSSVESATLLAATVEWLQYLGVADSVQTFDKGKLGHELGVKTPGVSRFHDLTHAGVGLSQVLPIVVSALLAAPDTTLLFEQPELHLNPRVQARLADFFLSMALIGKQCIVETHSEYLVNRLRFRSASSGKEIPVSSMVKLYFVEKKAENSTLRQVSVNEYGAIPDWPAGFFDQSQDEAEQIMKAASAKRRSIEKNSEDTSDVKRDD